MNEGFEAMNRGGPLSLDRFHAATWLFAFLAFPREMLKWFIYQWFALYLLTFTIDTIPAWEPGSPEVLQYWETWKPTIYTWPAAALWLYCAYRFFAAGADVRRRRRAGEVVRSDAVQWMVDRVPAPGVHQPPVAPNAGTAPAPAPPVAVPPPVVVQPEPQPGPDAPTLIIPRPSNRRVHRSSETASGVPMRDRRVVDPQSL
jgi:hypothetical protein